jgi:hypothetical protein
VRCIRLLAVFAPALAAQSLMVRSEFLRTDPFGEIVKADRTDSPQEILSPAVVRNGWASFQVAATVPQGVSFLYVQQNPELFEVTVYRERFTRTRHGWIPDSVQKVALPYRIILPDPVAPIPHQTTAVFWLDLRIPEKTPAGRMRLQLVLNSLDRWVVYPMEVRVRPTIAPAMPVTPGRVPPVTSRADAAARDQVCGAHEPGGSAALSVRSLIRRNVLQDLSLAREGSLAADFCKAPPESSEWWLAVRRKLY